MRKHQLFVFAWSLLFALSAAEAQENDYSAYVKKMRADFVAEAHKYLGAPYMYGGRTPEGFDCSGFVAYAAKLSCNYNLARRSEDIFNQCSSILDGRKETGDLLFFKTMGNDRISHVGIYIGEDKFIHAASEGPQTGVIISSLQERYYKRTYYRAGRFLPSAAQAGESAGVSEAEGGAKERSRASLRNFLLDSVATFNWSFHDAKKPAFGARGFSVCEYLMYTGWSDKFVPGIGVAWRYNSGTRSSQVPIFLGLDFVRFLRAYIGFLLPVNQGYAPGTDKEIVPQVFPGIVGLQFHSPYFNSGRAGVRFVQEINYSFYDAAAGLLSASGLFFSGLEFSTGLSVTFPFG